MKRNKHVMTFEYELINDTTAHLYIGKDKEPFTSVKIDKGTMPIGHYIASAYARKRRA